MDIKDLAKESVEIMIWPWRERAEKAEADNADFLLELYYQGLDMEIAEKMRDRFEADNAVLLAGLRHIAENEICQRELEIKMAQFRLGFAFDREKHMKDAMNCKCAKCTADRILATPDPGATLLKELEDLRKVVEAANSLIEFILNNASKLVTTVCLGGLCDKLKTLNQVIADLEKEA